MNDATTVVTNVKTWMHNAATVVTNVEHQFCEHVTSANVELGFTICSVLPNYNRHDAATVPTL